MMQTVSSEYVQHKVINNYNYYVPISKICHKNIWHKLMLRIYWYF